MISAVSYGGVAIPAHKKLLLKSARDLVYESIQESVVSNQYAPGDELQIDRLAVEFGVSTTPVREALIRLEGEGLVTFVRNKGARVTEIQEEDVRHIWEMRLLLEPYAASLSAQLDLTEQIDELDAAFSQLLKTPTDLKLYMDADIRLHQLFYSHLSNPLLVSTIQNTLRRSMRLRYFAEKVPQSPENVVRVVIGEHTEILNAMKQKDGKRAAEALALHLRNGEQRTREALRRTHS